MSQGLVIEIFPASLKILSLSKSRRSMPLRIKEHKRCRENALED